MRKIIKNNVPVDWKSIDLHYLLKENYDPAFQARIDTCPTITVSDLSALKSDMQCAQLRYSNYQEFKAIADSLEIMNDLKVRFQDQSGAHLFRSFANAYERRAVGFLQKSFPTIETRSERLANLRAIQACSIIREI